MKTQAVVFVAAFLILTAFSAEIECISPADHRWSGKRELGGKVEKLCYTCILATLGCTPSYNDVMVLYGFSLFSDSVVKERFFLGGISLEHSLSEEVPVKTQDTPYILSRCINLLLIS